MDVEAALTAERGSTNERIVALERQIAWLAEQQSLDTYDDEHDPDGSTLSVQRAQLLGLLADARGELRALGRAAERVAAGSYGHCLTCSAAIAPARLEALPTAETCIACAESRRRPGRGR